MRKSKPKHASEQPKSLGGSADLVEPADLHRVSPVEPIELERLRLAIRALNAAIYDWDLATDQIKFTPHLPHLFELTGYSPDQAVTYHHWWLDQIHPEDQSRYTESLKQLIANGTRFSIEYRVRRKDGSFLAVTDRAMIQRQDQGRSSRVLGFIQDMTEYHHPGWAESPVESKSPRTETTQFYDVQSEPRAQAELAARDLERIKDQKITEEALRASENQLRLITNAVPVLISYVDATQHFRFNNQAYEEWYGRPQKEFYGKHLKTIIGDTAYEAIRPHVERVLSGERVAFEILQNYRRREERYLHAIYVPDFNENGIVKGFFALMNDITDRKQAEQVLRDAHARLEKRVQARTAELQAANEKLQKEIQERIQAQQALEIKSQRLERFHRLSVGRELNMIQLKNEIDQLLEQLERPRKYRISEKIQLRKATLAKRHHNGEVIPRSQTNTI